ncbi:Biotin/lipoyl attachment [Trypanosoma melophagium]|uniref:Biotin/lipoyl attachment n=1 Tax=Trypanosoma melophagium TaxID=715481 RepID=UPI00351AA8C2|nr:Biotin/lipoyl attachment [Trypanosoma melophagium]
MRRLSVLSRNLSAARRLHLTPLCLGKIVPYLLADIGEGIHEVEVVTVCVSRGDKIEEFEKICEVQSDKATVDITSRYTGVISAVHVTAGDMAIVGKPLVDVELNEPAADEENNALPKSNNNNNNNNNNNKEKDTMEKEETKITGDVQKNGNTQASLNPTATETKAGETTETAAGKKVLATPATRGFARDCGVDLSQITGTGPNGRILKEDINRFNTGKGGMNEDMIVPLTGIRRVMVTTMTEARAIPCYTACDEMELTALLTFRQMLKDALALRKSNDENKGRDDAAANGGSNNNNNNNNNNSNKTAGDKGPNTIKLSLMPFFLKAASMALLQYPELNAHISPDCINLIVKKSHNISFAMDSPKGLIVPVVRNVQQKSLFELALEIDELIALGRRNAIPPDSMRGGTFTISNIGSIGATYATPVILPPQVVIGAIGRLQVLPRFDANGDIMRANIAHISWTADHRVIDGATLVRFSNVFKSLLESPGLMLSETAK